MYNIEVDGHHCHHIGQQGLVVQNVSAAFEMRVSLFPMARPPQGRNACGGFIGQVEWLITGQDASMVNGAIVQLVHLEDNITPCGNRVMKTGGSDKFFEAWKVVGGKVRSVSRWSGFDTFASDNFPSTLGFSKTTAWVMFLSGEMLNTPPWTTGGHPIAHDLWWQDESGAVVGWDLSLARKRTLDVKWNCCDQNGEGPGNSNANPCIHTDIQYTGWSHFRDPI